MEKTIAVEEGLKPVKELLQHRGYNVVDIRSGRSADAAVINGMDGNIMGIQQMVMDLPVVNARGRTPEEVLYELESKLQH
jgi:hypothetical protein